ncbi:MULTISPECIES: DUF2267 domain-containing protein [Streptomyces]|uniref:DUF2267 domain-containing protein n=1 Tax=Streptomyces TaxID=1883 RepID=UPI0004C95789|nr:MULTISPECIES: DUF2267 domain-containing protein [Streptomyces]KOU27670.1 hypothetical protein ADK53_36835 [Streptomyces sp. WM6373]KOU71051.1 hypothetical protein ADK96_06965 [Streptomyces sp. IGB124]KOU79038.1 hypothetical protein ADK93_34860 [Streptomyces sp. XY58]KOU84222.1 hypothetical protein ADK61_06220 [Streptomyces sp. XY66]KOV02899.1 hypothetical protein ADK89_28415 [Streptomyces sp. XY37]
MYDRPRPNQTQPAMTFDRMLERVRHEGAYPTRERAEEAVRAVLAALGRQVTADERVDLAQALPVEAALALTAQIPDAEPLTGWGFVKDLAARTGTSPAVARWDTGAVLAVVARLAGPGLLARILHRLPDGYALLFGQAQLRRPEPAAA